MLPEKSDNGGMQVVVIWVSVLRSIYGTMSFIRMKTENLGFGVSSRTMTECRIIWNHSNAGLSSAYFNLSNALIALVLRRRV